MRQPRQELETVAVGQHPIGQQRIVDAIDQAGLRYTAPDPLSLADVYRDVRDIAVLLGVPDRGEALVGSMQAALAHSVDVNAGRLVPARAAISESVISAHGRSAASARAAAM